MRVKLRNSWFAPSAEQRPNALQIIRGARYRAGEHQFPMSLLEVLPSSAEIVSGGPSGFVGKVRDWRKKQDEYPPVKAPETEKSDDDDNPEKEPYIDPRKELDIDRTSAEAETKKINDANGVGAPDEDDLKAKAAAFQEQLKAEQAEEEVSRDTKPERKRNR